MTLHEAILAVIKKNGAPMKAAEISQQINKFSLYRSKDKPVSSNQVWARVNKYKDLFRVTDDKKITELSEKYLQEEEFLRWIRNFLVHNYTVNSDILIPFLIYFIRLEERNFKNSSRGVYYDFVGLEPNRLKNDLLAQVEILAAPHLPEKFYQTLKSSFEKLDSAVLRNVLLSLERFSSFISEMNDRDFAKLFNKLISQVSGTKSRGFGFGTPDVVAKFISYLIELKPKQSVYDPYAGLCILLSSVVADKKGIRVFANDISENAGTVGILNLVVNGVEDFEYTFNEATRVDSRVYDWIVSNPPFYRSFTSKGKSVIPEDPFESSISYIYSRLNSNGRAVIVVPDSFLFTEDKIHRRLRGELVIERAVKAVVSLPNGIFQPYSGTATSILFLEKGKLNDGIFFADFSNISKDELDFKTEEFSNNIRKQKDLDKLTRFIHYDFLALNEEFNLLPRKNILQSFNSSEYIQKGIPLRELIERRIPGVQISSANINDEQDGTPYLRIADLIDEPRFPYITKRPSKYVSDIEEMKSIRLIETGNIAVSKVGNKLKPSVYLVDEPAAVGSNILSFSIKNDKILPEYLVHELNSDYVQEQLDAIQIRGIGPNYYREKDLLNLRILVPSIQEQMKKFYSKKPELSGFWGKFKDGIIDLFHEEENKSLPEKKVKEEEIISSIKHRIAQYVSPVSSDLKNLELYLAKKKEEGTPFSNNDKISGREDALSVTDVLKRMEKNLQGIGQTFDLMKNILYFNKEDSLFVASDISSLIKEAHDSLKDKLVDVIFSLTIEESVQEEDLIIPVDKRQIVELLRNFFINSVKHGFDESIPKKIICILITKNTNNNFLELNLINNGKPFPEGFTIDDFTSFGRKGTDSNGTGIGGYLMKKIVDNHEGKLEWLGDEGFRFTIESGELGDISSIATVHFKISLPYINN